MADKEPETQITYPRLIVLAAIGSGGSTTFFGAMQFNATDMMGCLGSGPSPMAALCQLAAVAGAAGQHYHAIHVRPPEAWEAFVQSQRN